MASFLDEWANEEDDEEELEWDEAVFADEQQPAARSPPSHPEQQVVAPSPPKRQKRARPATEARKRADRALRHRIETLCLLTHCRMLDQSCGDRELQAHLLSLATVPSDAAPGGWGWLALPEQQRLLDWFRSEFRLEDELGCVGVPRPAQLVQAVAGRAQIGLSRLDAHMLLVALFRAAGRAARLVFALWPASAMNLKANKQPLITVWAELLTGPPDQPPSWLPVDCATSSGPPVPAGLSYVVGFSGSDARDLTARYTSSLSSAHANRLRGGWFDNALAELFAASPPAAEQHQVGCRARWGMTRLQILNASEDEELLRMARREPIPKNKAGLKGGRPAGLSPAGARPPGVRGRLGAHQVPGDLSKEASTGWPAAAHWG